jgi:glycosyltransferase involved in cell wall biosynthesis
MSIKEISSEKLHVTNTNSHPVKVSKWRIPPGKTISGIPMSFKETFLKQGCEIRDSDGRLVDAPSQTSSPIVGSHALFSFEDVDTALEYSDGISVVIPTYNRSRPIAHAIKSVITQKHPNCEVVVVDDGSGDVTPQVVMDLRQTARNNQVLLTYILTSDNLGIAEARNIGTAISKHDNIVTLDSDDVMHPRSLSYISEAFADKTIDVVYGNHNTEVGDTYNAPDFSKGRLASSGCYILGVRGFRKRLWEIVGGFDETMASSEDLDILIRFEDIGANFHKIDEVLCTIGDYGDRTTQVQSKEVNQDAGEARGRATYRRRAAWPIRC